ncbi:MAG: bifunctional folylpolyglutamate synthase/dihydrofolate synthase [Streptosporangiales bacterium]|nr:bifunctional folylpolyglutamate synthase/dihydrofolate synthase [Streptosporangiales bacterium]MBO0892111.1 bifunctional folylpolyglutamate synthase/dihydrofolate synthase [Acidothermales bacterium]
MTTYADVERALLARWPETRMEPSLDRIRLLMDLMGDPQRSFTSVHITGTNGKTSTGRMIDALLRELGLRVGRYSSPHLQDMRERVALLGDLIDAETFVRTHEEVLPYVGIVEERLGVPMSFFEVITGMAYAAFADAPVDAAVVEVGLGGAWDATNVIDAAVAVFTPISLDHTHLLGDDVTDIAAEKAGIVKPDSFVVTAQQPVPAAEVIMRRCAEVGATIAREGLEFGVLSRDVAVGGQLVSVRGLETTYEDVFIPLHGTYQAGNAAVAIAAVEAFGAKKELEIDAVRAAFADVRSPGRLEVVRRSPTVLVDSSHNPAGMRATVAALDESFSFQRLVGVVGVMRDKDVAGVLEALEPALDHVVATRNNSDRSMPPEELGELARDVFGPERVTVAERLDDALDTAIALAEEGADLVGSGLGVLVTGSVVTAGDARILLGGTAS